MFIDNANVEILASNDFEGIKTLPTDISVEGSKIDDKRFAMEYMTSQVCFQNNVVEFQYDESAVEGISVAIVSYGDVMFRGNRSEYKAEIAHGGFNSVIFGYGVLVNGNQFMEKNTRVTMFSCYTRGSLLNNTSSNQATHCFLIPNAAVSTYKFANQTLASNCPAGNEDTFVQQERMKEIIARLERRIHNLEEAP